MMNRKSRYCVTALLFVMLPLLAHAQVLVKKSAYATQTSIPPFTGDPALAAQATKILSSDLDRSGWFKIVAAGSGEFNIIGVATRNSGGFSLEVRVFSRATNSQVYGKRFSGNSDGQLRQVVHALADDIVENLTNPKQKGIAQTKIAFISNRTGKKELYVADYDGYNPRQITSDGSISARPRWSSDRNRIVYLSYKSRWPDVYVIDLASGRRTRVASYPGLNSGGAFSPGGGQLALVLSKDGNPELYTMSSEGGSLNRLTSTKGAESSPCWSPDGSQIAFSYDGFGLPNICIVGAQGGPPTRVTAGGYYTEPDWSPSSNAPMGNMIACVGRVGKSFQIFTFDPASPSGTFKQQTSDGADNEDPTFAPDGRHIVFSRTSGYRSQLYVLDLITGDATNLGLNLSDCVEPAWSR